MELSLSTLQSAQRKRTRRVGRGDGSGRGTYSGRGMKGQRSRTGGRNRLRRRGLKQMLMQVPKLRGFRARNPRYQLVNVGDLETAFKDQSIITLRILKEKGIIREGSASVKLLGGGTIKKKLTVYAHKFSKSAEDAITKAGGTVHRLTLPAVRQPEKHKKQAS